MANTNRILIGAVVLLAVLLISLIGVFVWRERSRPDDNKKFTSSNLRRQYPSYFRNLTEQAVFKSAYFAGFENPKPVNQTVYLPNKTCTIQCNLGLRSRKSISQTVYHGCCQSYVEFLVPTKLPNLAKKIRNIVQLDANNQYFLKHKCSKVAPCSGCRCSQSEEIHTGVVRKNGVSDPDDLDDVEIDFFKLDGCCRCINT